MIRKLKDGQYRLYSRGMKTLGVVLALALALGGCGARERPPDAETVIDTSGSGAVPAQPSAVAPFDSTGPDGARDVVRRYYAAIDRGDYRDAYGLWARGGAASGQTYDAFAAGFSPTAHARVEFTGLVTTEGAAGSIFAAVPVRVHATTRSGEDEQFTGTYVLRRVNDVPGATPQQLRWHIHSARLVEERKTTQ